MSKNKLKNDISQKLKNLEEKVEKVRNVEINSDDCEKWDPDYYSELQTNLEEALAILNDKVVSGKKDEFGDPIILEKGILTLFDEWKEENNEEEEDDEEK